MTDSSVRERALVAGLVLFFAAGLFPILRSLEVSDLVSCYPHVTSDSFDWIRNGLFWAGENVVPSFRPPALPWIVAILYRAKALPLLPYVNFAALAVCAALLYRFVRERHGAGAAALAVLVFGTNDFVLDHTKYVMVEVYGALAILLAAFFFFRSGEDERAYVPFGLSLGLGFLFHYATLPAGVGFAGAVLLTRRPHVRRRWLWLGAAAAALPPVAWLLYRSWAYRHAPPGVLLVHIIEPLFGLQRDNLGFYAVAGIALLGLPLLPLYGFGLSNAVKRARAGDPWAWSVLAPTLSVLVFFVFFYDWADKRFLLYVFPLVVALLAGAFDALLRFASRGAMRAGVVWSFLAICLLWNVIRYPSYGIRYLALTPRDFFEGRSLSGKTSGKLVLSLRGGHVVRLHDTVLGSFSRSLFDYRRATSECGIRPGDRVALEWIGGRLDTFLPSGAPVGLLKPSDWHDDDWTATNKASILLRRPVTWPAAILTVVLATDHVPDAEVILACGRFRVYRRNSVPPR